MMRELIAYILIALVILVASFWLVKFGARRKQEQLRRRGIKNYNH